MPLDERTGGRVRVCSRVHTCHGSYFLVSKVVRAHVVTVLTAAVWVASKWARIDMMTIFLGRVNGTVTSDLVVL